MEIVKDEIAEVVANATAMVIKLQKLMLENEKEVCKNAELRPKELLEYFDKQVKLSGAQQWLQNIIQARTMPQAAVIQKRKSFFRWRRK